jgi:TusE/DsrC/DsvC family sulfur relay protein
MPFLNINNTQFKVDRYGYLLKPQDWRFCVAEFYADKLNVVLTDDHWKIIGCARKCFIDQHAFLTCHVLSNPVSTNFLDLKALNASRAAVEGYMRELFPGETIRQSLHLMAGLPNPSHELCTQELEGVAEKLFGFNGDSTDEASVDHNRLCPPDHARDLGLYDDLLKDFCSLPNLK